ncbi:hypothetical protein AU255_14665 [Methyloprofundus sedimenti]|uniref:Uncharacterized protein n=1 Tax=Methyloprofundus sedimenti TaxID=1420851 RepID=A0A1V8M1M8_9GAMM|nr:hypothetical protein AU255_14665 [Methyloprofundus sedimenti]
MDSIHAAHSLPTLSGLATHEVHRFNNRMNGFKNKNGIRLCKKIQTLLEGFFWPIDNGRLMGDLSYSFPEADSKIHQVGRV